MHVLKPHTRLKSPESSLKVTLVDTPGQDIFFRMRNYGADVADIAALVVAVDQGVSPQTEESIGLETKLYASLPCLCRSIDCRISDLI